jgi:hypothetical protein
MGRYRIQLDIENSEALARFYDFEWALIGNLGVDLLVVPLAKLFGLELAVKLIVMSIPALTVAGFLWVAREVQGRIPAHRLFRASLRLRPSLHLRLRQFRAVDGFRLPCLRALASARALWQVQAAGGVVRADFVMHMGHPHLRLGTLGLMAFSAEAVASTTRAGFHRRRVPCWIHAFRCAAAAADARLAERAMSAESPPIGSTVVQAALGPDRVAGPLAVVRSRCFGCGRGAARRGGEASSSSNIRATCRFAHRAAARLHPAPPGSSSAPLMRTCGWSPICGASGRRIRYRPCGNAAASKALAVAGSLSFLVRTAGTTASFWLYDRSYDRELAALDHVPQGARLAQPRRRASGQPWAMTRLSAPARIGDGRKGRVSRTSNG